jgi:hypothetical protein
VRKLQIEENKSPVKELSNSEREKMMTDAKKFLILIQKEKADSEKPTVDVNKNTDSPENGTEIKYDKEKPLESMLLTLNNNFKQAKVEDKKLIQTDEQIHSNVEKIRNNLKD